MMLFGLLNLPWWGDIIAVLVMTHITFASITIYLHRHQAHKALSLHPIISHFFRFWLWLTTGMVTKEWVAIHRKHHAKCETVDDPHSPQIYGLRKVLWHGVELYRAEASNQETMTRYGKGTPNDWIERHLYTRFSWLGVVIMALIDLSLFGLAGISVWGVQMLWTPLLAAGVINGIGHYWGYRNFECPDAARNLIPWGFLISGEELHNNHHTFPLSAKLSVKPWEFDLGWFYINTLRRLGLAKVFRVPPKLKRNPDKTSIDYDTVSAIITHRFQIMARYSKEVMIPVLQAEKRQASDTSRSLLRRAKALLIREQSLMDERGKKRLTLMLTQYNVLQQVYHYRLRLQEIWSQTTNNQKELLEKLQEWCRQAEATGIDALRQFAKRLQSYVPQAV